MRKFLSFAALLALLSGCAQADGVNEKLPVSVDAPETLYAEFDTDSGDKEDETRTYVVDEWMLRWHEGDEISFFPVTYNMCYRFNGETGDNGGSFSKLTTDLVTGNELPTRYALYPYQDNTTISDEGRITYHFPDQQVYGEKSFGRGANVMVAATENHDDNVLRFKNVGGYLKLQIYSSEQRWLDYIELEGNNGERITGEAYIETSYGWDPWVEMSENAGTMLTLDCVDTEHWVDIAISTDPENPTDFWFVLPPTYFDNGITVRIYDTEGNICTKSTYNWIPVERNCIQPLSTFEFVADGGNQGGGNEDLELSSWGVFGSMTDWSNDIPMYIYENYHVAYNVSMIAGDEFKFRKDSAWDFNYGGDFIGFGERTSAIRDGGNIQIPEDGIYDIYFDSYALVFYIMYAGEVPSGGGVDEPVAPEGEVPYNQIWYTTLDESLLVPNNDDFGGAVVVSNTYENGLGVITFDRNVYKIGFQTFYGKTSINTIKLPNCITYIEAYGFTDCVNLTYINIPEDIQFICSGQFTGCYSLKRLTGKYVTDDGRCVIMNNKLETVAPAELISYTIPEGVTTIAGGAFRACRDLKEIIISEGVETIDDTEAFAGCDNLEIVVVPSTLKYLGGSAFKGCARLTRFEGPLASDDNRCLIIDNTIVAFARYGVETYTIPEYITSIGADVFRGCEELTAINIHDNVSYIGGGAFGGCNGLRSITIPDKVTVIEPYTFEYCHNLYDVKLGKYTTTIRYMAFVGCESLRMLYLPSTIESIEWGSLQCPSMTELYCAAPTPPYLEGDTIYGDVPGRTIYVPVDSVTAYQTADVWSDFADEFVGYDFENNETPAPPTTPVNPEDCEWADVYLSLPTEEYAANGFYPFNCIFINVTGTNLISGRYIILDIAQVGTEVTIEKALAYSSSFDPSWIDSINNSGSIILNAGATPSTTFRVIIELTNENGDLVRFDRVITTTEAVPHTDMEKWVGTWSLSADQVVNWTYVDGAYNGPALIDKSATYDITIEAATDIGFNIVRVYGLTSLTTSNGEPISVLAYIHNDGYLILEAGTASIEQINESEFTYWLPYVQTSNGVEVIPAYSDALYLTLSEDGLTATTASRGSIEYNGEVYDVIGMDVFAFDGNTGAIREMFNPETMPEVNSPAGNITLTRTSSAAKAAYAPTKRASVANGTFKIEMVK